MSQQNVPRPPLQNRPTNPNMNSIPIISNVVSLAPQGKYYDNIIHVVLILILRAIMAVIVWKLDLQLPVQSVPVTSDVVSSNLDQVEVYNIM